MARSRSFRVLLASDGSATAKAAFATALGFPWPEGTEAQSVTARQTDAEHRRSILLAALDRGAESAAEGARRALVRRWPDATSTVVDARAVDGVLGEAKRIQADAIVLGWRGHAAVRRLMMGSVSRGVVRGAGCAVLVVRRRVPDVRRIVIGIDESEAAQRAVRLVATFERPSRSLVTLVRAEEPVAVPSHALTSGALRASVSREIRRINTERAKAARRSLDAAAAILERSGWKTRTMLTAGAPVADLLAAAAKGGADLLVVGKRGTSGVPRLLLGSVAEGILDRSPIPVLVVP